MSLWTSIQGLFGIKPKARRNFPKWCAPLCHRALAEMKAAIQSKGIKLKDGDLTVIVRTEGVERRKGGWGFYVPELYMWAGATTSADGKRIEIAIDPAQFGNPGGLHYDSLKHEMGHHWLIRNNRGGGHDALFDDVVPGWKEARKFTGKGRA
jgi:hypothetical protein